MSITVVMPDGIETKPVEFYKHLAMYFAEYSIPVTEGGGYTHLLRWNSVRKSHDVVLMEDADQEVHDLIGQAEYFISGAALHRCDLAGLYDKRSQPVTEPSELRGKRGAKPKTKK